MDELRHKAPDTGKDLLRTRLRRHRRESAPRPTGSALLATAQSLPELSKASTVGLFVSSTHEPDTGPLRGWLRDRATVLLPITQPDLDVDWARDIGSTPQYDARSIPIPDGPALGTSAIQAADILLIPALAVDRQGNRLGQGGGSYDRVLARVAPGTPIVAVIFDEELMDETLPIEPHDQKVSHALTPVRWVEIGNI